MGFLNKKEDVIDFELTQYGKLLVSQGKFKPVYYAFFDDDIIYDQRYANGGGLETQKNIETRIFDNTPSLNAQYLFHSVDIFEKQQQIIRTDSSDPLAGFSDDIKEKLQQTPEKHYALTSPLGNSSLITDYAPSFTLTLAKGEISNVEIVISGSDNKDFSIQKIPQINLKDVVFYVKAVDGENITPDVMDEPFADGSYLSVIDNHITLSLKEENVPLTRDNFDIEVYALDENGNIEHPLYFLKGPEDLVQNGILIGPGDPLPSHEGYLHDLETTDIGAGLEYRIDYGFDAVRQYFETLIDGEIVLGPERKEEGHL